jgi:hypothetical protein
VQLSNSKPPTSVDIATSLQEHSHEADKEDHHDQVMDAIDACIWSKTKTAWETHP